MVKIIERETGLLSKEASERELEDMLNELSRNNAKIDEFNALLEGDSNPKTSETYESWIAHYVNENVHLIYLIEIKKVQLEKEAIK